MMLEILNLTQPLDGGLFRCRFLQNFAFSAVLLLGEYFVFLALAFADRL